VLEGKKLYFSALNENAFLLNLGPAARDLKSGETRRSNTALALGSTTMLAGCMFRNASNCFDINDESSEIRIAFYRSCVLRSGLGWNCTIQVASSG
jgi:hypothetical protein